MPAEITTANRLTYENNFNLLASQKTSRLQPYCTSEDAGGKAVGEIHWIDFVGNVTVRDKTTRHEDTPVMANANSRRGLIIADSDGGTLVSQLDLLRTLNDPTSAYYSEWVQALMRKLDQVIINAALGSALSQTGGATGPITTVALPAAQTINADGTDVSLGTPGATSGKNLTVAKLRAARAILETAEIGLDENPTIYLAASPKCKQQLLASVKPTSMDYVPLAALVNGQVNRFLDFQFIWMNNLPLVTGSTAVRRAFAFGADAISLATPMAPQGTIYQRGDKCLETQIYVQMTAGAVRREDVRVVEIDCDEGVVDVTTVSVAGE